MNTIALIATGLVAVLHLYILYLEMFLWDTPKGRKAVSYTHLTLPTTSRV